MSKLSRGDIIKGLIEMDLVGGEEYSSYLARQFDYELDRMKLTLWGFSQEQLAESKTGWRARTTRSILEEYYESHGDRWLRELYKRNRKQQRDLV